MHFNDKFLKMDEEEKLHLVSLSRDYFVPHLLGTVCVRVFAVRVNASSEL